MLCKTIVNAKNIELLGMKDESMKILIAIVGSIDFEVIADPFISLVNSIVYQQLSFKAANSIWKRVESLVGEITPEKILEKNHEELRSCGVSNSKAIYIKNIANSFVENGYSRDYFENLTDEEIVDELVKIKGVGKWTADMFLIFCLARENVLSFADLSLKNGLRWLYQLDREVNKSDYDRFYKLFSPYNTLASLYIWKIQERKLDRYENIYEI